MVQAYILIQTEVGKARDVAAAISQIKGVARVDAVTGPYDVIVLTEAASVDELATTYEYGRITTLATGTRNQETLGAADSGEIVGNRIVIRVSLAHVDEAVGGSVYSTRSTGSQAQSQLLIGTSVTGGLLLNADQASGSDFVVEP